MKKWEVGIADRGLALEMSVIHLEKLNWHFPATWTGQQETGISGNVVLQDIFVWRG
jgi:hypothetical protein